MKIAINTSAVTCGDIDFSPFEALGEVKFFGELTKEQQKKLISDCEALIINKVIVDEELLAACPKLRYVGIFATGYNNVDLAGCKKRGIAVCNVPGYSTNAVAQHAIALLLYVSGRLDRYIPSVAAGDWVRSETFCYFPWGTRELYGKTFGIYGYGAIGRAAAKIADGLGMKVLVCTRTKSADCPYEYAERDEMFARSDVLSLHCPLNEETRGLVNAHTLSLMKRDAVLINTARGGLVDERALAEALNGGKIAAACLDTVAEEPMSADNPLLGAANCYITPHIAWTARETRERLVRAAYDNLRAFLCGKPQNCVV